MDDSVRGVSDIVSFTLVFSTIILMIGVVTVTGVGTLGDVQEGTETNVAEETMRNYAGSLADHRSESAPRRSSTIKLQGHQLTLETAASLHYETNGTDETPLTTGALVRTTETDARLVYQSGGLFRVQDGGSVVVRQPPLRCGSDAAHLAVTTLEPEDSAFSISADNRVTIESELRSQTISEQRVNTVTIDAGETANNGPTTAEAWSDSLSGEWNKNGDEYTCNVDRLVVHRTVVSIDIVS